MLQQQHVTSVLLSLRESFALFLFIIQMDIGIIDVDTYPEENKWERMETEWEHPWDTGSNSETGSSQCTDSQEEESWSPSATTRGYSMEWLIYDTEYGNWSCVLPLPDYIFKDMQSLHVQSEWLLASAYSGTPVILRDVKVQESRRLNTVEKMLLDFPGPGNTETEIVVNQAKGQICMTLPSESYPGALGENWSKISAIFIYGTREGWKIYCLYEPCGNLKNGEMSRLWCITVTPELARLDAQLRSHEEIISYCTVLTESGSMDMLERDRLLSMISTAGSVTDYCFICWTDIDLDSKLKEATPMRIGRRFTSLLTTPQTSGMRRD